MSSKILCLVYFFKINWINFVFVELLLCSWSLGWQQEIIKPREKVLQGYKESIDAELSYFTERYGFVDDEHVQHSGSYVDPKTGNRRYLNPAEQVLRTFVSEYLRGNEAEDTRITKRYFDHPFQRTQPCLTYFQDPIFQYNNIKLVHDNSERSTLYEVKLVEFQYFTRKTELVKVIKCPVVMNGYRTRLYFLEINHRWMFGSTRRGYFVFFNKVVPREATHQPLKLLMFVSPNVSESIEIETEGEEAKLYNALRSVSRSAINIRLRVRQPEKPQDYIAVLWSAKMMIEKMNEAETKCLHLFGEDAEIMLRAKNYGFFDLLRNRARPWRMKKMISILDHMGKDYVIDRKRMKAVRNIDPKKSCRSYIFLNDQLSDRKIVPHEHLLEAGYVSKLVEFKEFEYHRNNKPRELLRCPITYGETREPRNIYLLPIYYENSAKLPQLFTFFEDPGDPERVNVYTLSPLPSNVDEIDFSLMDQNLIDFTGVPSTSDPHHSRTSSDLEILRTASPDWDTTFLPTASLDSDTTSFTWGPVDSAIAPLTTGPASGPVYSDAASLTRGPVNSDTLPPITGQVFTQTDALPMYPDFENTEGR